MRKLGLSLLSLLILVVSVSIASAESSSGTQSNNVYVRIYFSANEGDILQATTTCNPVHPSFYYLTLRDSANQILAGGNRYSPDYVPCSGTITFTATFTGLYQWVLYAGVKPFDWTIDYSITDPSTVPSTDPSSDPAKEVRLSGSSDNDGDGIPNSRDNCINAYNPDQEDGWGSLAGDACDTDWYNVTGIGVAGFEQKDGIYHLHGNCTFMSDGDPRCPEIAIFNPSTFVPDSMPMDVTTEYAGTWSVWLYYLNSNDGVDVYQANIYTTNPPQPDTLIDDRLEIHVASDGSWQWYRRGGDSSYNGL
ncbi:MAG: hypothetical protein K8J31_15235 [Anaerolineae bacterium]|nr:hypothetical protein [Anaerolineae bacterium]